MQWKLMIIGMTAEYAGPLLSRMPVRKLVGKPDKKTNRYQITQKGKEFLINPLRRLQRSNLHQNHRMNHRQEVDQ